MWLSRSRRRADRRDTSCQGPQAALSPRHFLAGMQAGFLGSPFHRADVLVVASWGLVGLLVAIRYFRWEPPTD